MQKRTIAACAAILGLMSCASQHRFVKNPPFEITEPRVQDWAGGREQAGTGTQLSMRWNPYDPEAFRPDTLYFRGRALKPVIEDTDTGMRLTASYTRMVWEKKDMIMSADSLKEIGNQPPFPYEKPGSSTFELERDQAVLTYIDEADGERYYYKIVGIKEYAPRNYPGRPQN